MGDIAEKERPPPAVSGMELAAEGDEVSAMKLEAQGTAVGGPVESTGQFSSRWAFWISAIGCSVGFGNIWRFPYLVWSYGGGAFFIPYVISLIVVAIPVSMLEFGMGQLSQGALPKAFRSIHPRAGSLGFGVIIVIGVLIYYPLLLSWTLVCFGYSCQKNMPWLATDAEKEFCTQQTTQIGCESNIACLWDGTQCEAQVLNKAVYFFENMLSAKPEYWEGIKEFNWKVFLCQIGIWTLTGLASTGGARILGYLNYFITVAPGVFLIVLVGVGASLDGAAIGLKAYLGKFDVKALQNPAIWTDACSQTLFSLGAIQGSMAGYAANNPRNQNFVQDTYVVVVGDTVFAIIAGLAVFAVTGYMSKATGIPLEDLPLSGTGLAFQTYPVGLGEGIPAPGSQIMSVLFFLTLWLLGMGTMVGLLEAVVLSFVQSKLFARNPSWKRWHAVLGCCIGLFLLGIILATDMGVHILDAVDIFVNTFGFLCVGGVEAIVAGWMSALDLWLERTGAAAVYTHMVTFIVGGCLGSILGFALPARLGQIVGPVVGAVIVIGGWAVAWFLTIDQNTRTGEKYGCGSRLYNLMFYNVEQLRGFMNNTACQDTDCCKADSCCMQNPCCAQCCGECCKGQKCCNVPFAWGVCIKYITPLIAMLLFFNALCNPYALYKAPSRPGNNMPTYLWWLFLYGNIWVYFMIFMVFAGMIWPILVEWFGPSDEYEAEYPDRIKKQAEEDFPPSQAVVDASPGATTEGSPPAAAEETPSAEGGD